MAIRELLCPNVVSVFTHWWNPFAGTGSYNGDYYRCNATSVVNRNFVSALSSAIVGVSIKIGTVATGIQRVVVLYAAAGPNSPQVTVTVETSGAMKVYSGGTAGTLLTTYGAGITSAEFNIEVLSVCHASAGTIQVRLNGVEVISLTGVNTNPIGTGTFAGYCLSTFTGSLVDFRNYFYGDASSGTTFMFTPKGGRMAVLTLDEDGSEADWTPDSGPEHYDRINAVGATGPGYVASISGGVTDTFPPGEFPPSSWLIKAVESYAYLRPASAIPTTSFLHVVRRSGVNTNWGSAISHPSPIFPAYRGILGANLETDPTTATDWDTQDFFDDTIEFGFTESTSTQARVGHLAVVAFLVPDLDRSIGGELEPSGSRSLVVERILDGSAGGVGSLDRLIARPLTAVETPTGLISARLIRRSLDGLLEPEGLLVRRPQRFMSGLLIPSGSLVTEIVEANVMADPISALVEYLRDNGYVVHRTESRIYSPELPAEVARVMPVNCIVLIPAGGSGYGSDNDMELQQQRIDVKCYGTTPYESNRLHAGLRQALRTLQREVRSRTLIHWLHEESSAISLREPEVDWPLTFSVWSMLSGTVATDE